MNLKLSRISFNEILENYSEYHASVDSACENLNDLALYYLLRMEENAKNPLSVLLTVKEKYSLQHVISLVWPTRRYAEIAKNTLDVDLQALADLSTSFVDVEDCRLTITVSAASWRVLRVKTNAFYESLALIAETIEKLDHFMCTSAVSPLCEN